MTTRKKINRSWATTTLVGTLSCLASSAMATEWSIEPSISASTGFSDNVRLQAPSVNGDPIQSNIILSVAPAVKVGIDTEVRSVSARGRVVTNRFTKDATLNNNDAYLDINWREKGERSEFALISNNAFESTLGTLLENFGVPTERRQRQKVSAFPNYTYNYTDRAAVSLGYRFEDVGYRDAQATSLVDYRSNEIIPGWRYKLDQGDEVEVKATIWRLITIPDSAQVSRGTFKTALLDGLYKRPINERSSWSAGAGLYSVSENVTASLLTPIERTGKHTGVTANVRYQLNMETGIVSANVVREVSPSGQNTILLSNRLGVNWSQGLTPYLNASVAAGFYKNKSIAGPPSADSQYFRLAPGINWKPGREWDVDGGLAFQKVTTSSGAASDTSARAKSAFINVTYYWNRTAISR